MRFKTCKLVTLYYVEQARVREHITSRLNVTYGGGSVEALFGFVQHSRVGGVLVLQRLVLRHALLQHFLHGGYVLLSFI